MTTPGRPSGSRAVRVGARWTTSGRTSGSSSSSRLAGRGHVGPRVGHPLEREPAPRTRGPGPRPASARWVGPGAPPKVASATSSHGPLERRPARRCSVKTPPTVSAVIRMRIAAPVDPSSTPATAVRLSAAGSKPGSAARRAAHRDGPPAPGVRALDENARGRAREALRGSRRTSRPRCARKRPPPFPTRCTRRRSHNPRAGTRSRPGGR